MIYKGYTIEPSEYLKGFEFWKEGEPVHTAGSIKEAKEEIDENEILKAPYHESEDEPMENTKKTYAEVWNNAPFDWNEFLNKESYTLSELDQADNLAASWVSCACGNLCSCIERNHDGSPKDEELEALGLKFSNAISLMLINHKRDDPYDTSGAKSILAEIEIRSAKLIKEIKQS
jgi:hypothetical protein